MVRSALAGHEVRRLSGMVHRITVDDQVDLAARLLERSPHEADELPCIELAHKRS